MLLIFVCVCVVLFALFVFVLCLVLSVACVFGLSILDCLFSLLLHVAYIIYMTVLVFLTQDKHICAKETDLAIPTGS